MSDAVLNLQAILAYFLQTAEVARFLGAASLVAIFYDAALTLDDEIAYIWRQKFSFPKMLFLINKYVVITVLFFITLSENNYNDNRILAKICPAVISIGFASGVFSLATANLLVIMRVVTLWDHNKKLKVLLSTIFVLTVLSNVIMMVYVLVNFHDQYKYSTIAHMCYIDRNSPLVRALWTSPLVFEATVLIAVVWNALYRPRKLTEPLRVVLLYDGFVYFGCLTVLRIINAMTAFTVPPGMASAVSSLCWSLITIILSRSTIAISKAAAKEFESLPNPQRISTIAGLSFYTHARRTSDSDNSDSTLDDTTTASVTSTESQPFVQGQVFVVSSLGSQSFLPDETSGPPLYEILDDKQREALVFQTSRSELIKGTIFERRPSPLGLLLEPGTSDACGWEIEMEERRTDNI